MDSKAGHSEDLLGTRAEQTCEVGQTGRGLAWPAGEEVAPWVGGCQVVGPSPTCPGGFKSLSIYQAPAVCLSTWETNKQSPWLELPQGNVHLKGECDQPGDQNGRDMPLGMGRCELPGTVRDYGHRDGSGGAW